MSIFELLSIKNLKVFDSTMFHLEETQNAYFEYANRLLQFPPTALNNVLQLLRDRNVIENQEAENNDSFLIALLDKQKRKNSISELVKIYMESGKISLEDVKYIHKLVIAGSEDDKKQNYDYRNKEDQWVGSFDSQGNKIIDYELIETDKVEETLQVMLDYLNSNGNTIMDNIFLKPFIFHLMFAVLQPFGNGNTRAARLLQHGKIWDSTNKIISSSDSQNSYFKYPILYLSKNYTLTNHQYREIIRNVAISNTNETWNTWFKYNLNMIDEQLHFMDTRLDEYTKHIR